MKRTFLSFIMTITLCISLTVPVFAKTDIPVTPEYVSSITVEIPQLPGFNITFTNVHGFFSYYQMIGTETNPRNYHFLIDSDTISFNRDMTVRRVDDTNANDKAGKNELVPANTPITLDNDALRFYVVDGIFFSEGYDDYRYNGFIEYVHEGATHRLTGTYNFIFSIGSLSGLLRSYPDEHMVYRKYEDGTSAYILTQKPRQVDQWGIDHNGGSAWGIGSQFQSLTEFNEEITRMLYEETLEDMGREVNSIEYYAEYHPEILTSYVPKYPEYLEEHHPELWALFGNKRETVTATPTASTVLVNNAKIEFEAYNIKGNNYFKLRDLAYVLNGTAKQFKVSWDGVNNAISLTSGELYTVVGGEMVKGSGNTKTATPTSATVYIDGKEISFTAYNIDGNNYFKLRDIGNAFDFGVDWDERTSTIIIDTNKGYTS